MAGTTIAQTRSIERFVAKQAGLYPEDPVAAAHVDAVLDICEDFITFIVQSAKGIDIKTEFEKFKAARKECATTGKKFKIAGLTRSHNLFMFTSHSI